MKLLICFLLFYINFSHQQNLNWLTGLSSYLSSSEEQTFCDWTKDKNTEICPEANYHCKNCDEISKKLNSVSKGVCTAVNVCSFQKNNGTNNNTIYLTSKYCVDKYIAIRSCGYNMSVLVPTTEKACDRERDFKEVGTIGGKQGAGVYEAPKVKPLKLCDGNNQDAIINCQFHLTDSLLGAFPSDKRIGWIVGPYCFTMSRSGGNDPAEKAERCCFQGIFMKDGKYDKFRIHAFNQKGATDVCLMAYWGNDTLEEGNLRS